MVFETVYIFLRIIKLVTLVAYEFIKFNNKKCINYLCNVPTYRLELIKKISKKLEHENIVYVKIFQALCFDKDLLTTDEQDYLIKYTDNVPYQHNEIDYDFLDLFDKSFFNSKSYDALSQSNFESYTFNTLIFWALGNNQINMVKFLLSKKIDLTILQKIAPSRIFNYDLVDLKISDFYNDELNEFKDYKDVFNYVDTKVKYDLIVNYITPDNFKKINR